MRNVKHSYRDQGFHSDIFRKEFLQVRKYSASYLTSNGTACELHFNEGRIR